MFSLCSPATDGGGFASNTTCYTATATATAAAAATGAASREALIAPRVARTQTHACAPSTTAQSALWLIIHDQLRCRHQRRPASSSADYTESDEPSLASLIVQRRIYPINEWITTTVLEHCRRLPQTAQVVHSETNCILSIRSIYLTILYIFHWSCTLDVGFPRFSTADGTFYLHAFCSFPLLCVLSWSVL